MQMHFTCQNQINLAAVLHAADKHGCRMQASLLVGGAGTAKTSIINLFLSRFNPEEASSKTITFSYLTTPQIFQMSVEVCCTHDLLIKHLIITLAYSFMYLSHSVRTSFQHALATAGHCKPMTLSFR